MYEKLELAYNITVCTVRVTYIYINWPVGWLTPTRQLYANNVLFRGIYTNTAGTSLRQFWTYSIVITAFLIAQSSSTI